MNRPGELARFVPDRGMMLVMAAGLVVFSVLAAWALAAALGEAEGEAGGSGILRAALWAVAVLCPVYGAEMAVRVARGTPTLAATEEGLVLRSLFGASARLRWDEVALVAPVEMGRKLWLAIYLHEPRAVLGRLGLMARVVLVRSHGEGVPNFAFRYYQLGTAPEMAAETLEAIRHDPAKAARRKGRGRR